MSAEKVTNHVYLIDTKPLGVPQLIGVYLVVGEGKAALIDAGAMTGLRNLLTELRPLLSSNNVRRLFVALTHIHLDHGGAAASLLKTLINEGYDGGILVHPRGVKHVVNPTKLWSSALTVLGEERANAMGKPEPIDPGYVHGVEDGEIIDLGDVKVKAIYTPGHAPHHVAYLVIPDSVAVTGDALAIHHDGKLHPVTPPPFRADLALASIEKIKEERPDVVTVSHYGVLPWRGEEALEKAKSKILQWLNIVENAVRKGLTDPDTVFEIILKEDPEVAEIMAARENNPIFRNSAKTALRGILEYVLTTQKH